MLELTESAGKELDAYFTGKDKSPIRIYLAPGGCSGPRLALALDQANEDDTNFEQQGYSFCINKTLLEQTGAISIDMTSMGFIIDTANPLGGGGGCSGCGSSCASTQ